MKFRLEADDFKHLIQGGELHLKCGRRLVARIILADIGYTAMAGMLVDATNEPDKVRQIRDVETGE